MKELIDLKVRALAVPLNDRYNDFIIRGNGHGTILVPYVGISHGFSVKLPKGKWQIVGRADDLNDFRMFKLIGGATLDRRGEWRTYCEANGLTNELILIEK